MLFIEAKEGLHWSSDLLFCKIQLHDHQNDTLKHLQIICF
jgi:hypothetical protein